MSRLSDRASSAEPSHRSRVLLAVALLGVLPASPAPASPIRHHSDPAPRRPARERDSLTAFLVGRPGLRPSLRAPRTLAEVRLAAADGLLTETPFVDELLRRRSLNPARFDHYHPRLGPILAAVPLRPPQVPARPLIKPTTSPPPRVVPPL